MFGLNQLGLGALVRFKSMGMEKLRQAGHEVNKLGNTIDQQTRRMRAGMAMTAIGVGLLATGFMGLRTTMDIARSAEEWQAQMANVIAVTGAVGKEAEALKQQTIDLGIKTEFTAGEVAKGQYMLASGGLSINQALEAMHPVLDMAVVDFVGLEESTKLAVTAMQGFRIPAEGVAHMCDVIVKASQQSMLRLQDMAYSYGQIAGVSYSANQSFEESTAALGMLTDRLGTAQRAGEILRMALASLKREAAIKELRDMGAEIRTATGGFIPLNQILDKLRSSLNKMNAEARDIALSKIFGRGGIELYYALADSTDELREKTDELTNAEGASKGYAEKLRATWRGVKTIFKGTIDTIKIVLGIPLIETFTGWLKALTDFLNRILQFLAARPQLAKMVSLFLFFGSVLSLFAGAVLSVIGPLTIMAAMKGITVGALIASSFKLATGALGAFLIKAAPFIGILGTLTTATGVFAIAWKKNWFGIGDAMKEVTDEVKGGFALLEYWVTGNFSLDITKASDTTKKGLNSIKDAVDYTVKAFKDLQATIELLSASYSKTTSPEKAQLATKYMELGEGGVKRLTTTRKLLDWLGSGFNKAFSELGKGWKGVSGILTGAWSEIAPKLGPAFEAIKARIKNLVDFAKFVLPTIIKGPLVFLKGVLAAFRIFWSLVKMILKIGLALITGIIKIALDLIAGNWNEAWESLKKIVTDILGAIWDHIKESTKILWESFWSILESIFGEGVKKVKNVFEDMLKFITGIFDEIAGVIEDVLGFFGQALGFGKKNEMKIDVVPKYNWPALAPETMMPANMFPKFQFGAEITRTGLAMVHRHEIISPVKNLAAQGMRLPERSMGGERRVEIGNINLSFPYARITKAEVREIARVISSEIESELKRQR